MAWDFAAELKKYGPSSSPGVATPGLLVGRSYCADVARSHYENFGVASILLPRKLLPHVHAVYAYCRWSDDLADETEGGDTALSLLKWWRGEFLNPASRHPVMVALRETRKVFNIPDEPFLSLLVAFEHDQRVKRYETFDDVLKYCRNSANPVGRLVLHLFECFDERNASLSDEICTGLQLANFWQDVKRDFAIGRVYLPLEDRKRFGVSESELNGSIASSAFRELLKFQVERTRCYFERGAALLPLLPKRVRGEIELFHRGGLAILNAIECGGYDVLTQRPAVTKATKLKLLLGALARKWFG